MKHQEPLQFSGIVHYVLGVLGVLAREKEAFGVSLVLLELFFTGLLS